MSVTIRWTPETETPFLQVDLNLLLLMTCLDAPFSSFLSTGIYQPETFKRDSKYGLTVLTTTEAGLLSYLTQIMSQMEHWLLDGQVQRLVVVVSGIDSGETLERWQFNVSVDDEGVAERKAVPGNENFSTVNVSTKGTDASKAKKQKSIKELHNEIQAIIRQITASVSHDEHIFFQFSMDLQCFETQHSISMHSLPFHRR